MVVPFEELGRYEFSLSDINALKQEPIYRTLNQKSRIFNSILIILRGSCVYSYEGGEFSLSEGGVAYLPYGSRHFLNVTSEDICFYRVDFTVRVDGEIALFSDNPIRLEERASGEVVEIAASLEDDCAADGNSVERMKKLCQIFSILQKRDTDQGVKRLAPAVKYLRENAVGNIDCGALAELCYMSKSRFYELFKAEFGDTPLGYRDSLLVKRACDLLASADVTVREAAFAVGFENAAYFSRFFKKRMGVSPKEYMDSFKNC